MNRKWGLILHGIARRPRGSGDEPKQVEKVPHFLAQTPHKWVVGSTFEYEFHLPMPINPAYQSKHKAKRTRKSARARTSTRSAAKQATTLIAKPKASKKPKKVRLTPEERKARAAENRRKLKVLGLCKDCRQRAIPGQTRCPDCAEKHRQLRQRQRQSQRQAKQII